MIQCTSEQSELIANKFRTKTHKMIAEISILLDNFSGQYTAIT